MVTHLHDLLNEAVATPPPGGRDVDEIVRAGRRRIRARRARRAGVATLAVGGVALGSTLAWTSPYVTPTLEEAGAPRPPGRVIDLADARAAVPGTDFTTIATLTNADLNWANGRDALGDTPDGKVLVQDGPHGRHNTTRYALVDAGDIDATRDEAWLPAEGQPEGGVDAFPVALEEDRLVLATMGDGSSRGTLRVHTYDRATQEWSQTQWSGLPKVARPWTTLGPDGRLYVRTEVARGAIPEGGWPVGVDGEAEDAGAEGDTYALWSVALDDPTDVREEGVVGGAFGFAGDDLVWTDAVNGAAGMVHVRDAATGEVTTWDPQLGERCNLLGFGVGGERIAMSQYCGTYRKGAGSVRDDRVQVFDLDGRLVTTVQDSGISGWMSPASGVLTLWAYRGSVAGTYAYDFASDQLVRLSEGHSPWFSGEFVARPGQAKWAVPAGEDGSTQVLADLTLQ